MQFTTALQIGSSELHWPSGTEHWCKGASSGSIDEFQLLLSISKALIPDWCQQHDFGLMRARTCLNRDGILEHYWGEHIHLGYYSEEERARGYKKKDFKQAKFDFVDEMLSWSGAQQPKRILDVGCGIGGTSRHLAAKFPGATVQGKIPFSCLLQA